MLTVQPADRVKRAPGFSLGDVIALDEGDEPAAGRPRIARLYHPECWEEEAAVGREDYEAAD